MAGSPETTVVTISTEIKEAIKQAEENKLDGNTHFREKRYDEALFAYRRGLECLPLRETTQVSGSDEERDNSDANPEPEPSRVFGPLEQIRSILNSNIGACHAKLGDHKRAVEACTQALNDDPKYVKALQRRATSNESLDTWTSLSAAQEDYTKILELLPESSPQTVEIRRCLQSLKPRVEVAQKKETAEMLDKLKGVGNSVLGYFGLSTDNFKLEDNGQGGYSVNFKQ